MRFYHNLFQPLHFDFGTMMWSVNHMPLFGAILSVSDHRRLGVIHNITFYALMKVLTNGRINRRQAQAIFEHIDLSFKGDISYSEMAFLIGIVVSHKDHMEREFLYMNAWKMWITFNETGQDRITTREFRRSGLFFDFDYPTMYEMFKDYDWDDEKQLEFDRFRFFLMSCIHFRQVRRFQAKYIRFRQFKRAVLILLKKALSRVLLENVFPSPLSIVKAIKTIKLPPLEGSERNRKWTDIFDCTFVRNYVRHQWEFVKIFWGIKMGENPRLRCCCKCICCGYWCAKEGDAINCCKQCARTCKITCRFYCKKCRQLNCFEKGTSKEKKKYRELLESGRIPRHAQLRYNPRRGKPTPIIIDQSMNMDPSAVPLSKGTQPSNIRPTTLSKISRNRKKEEKLQKRLIEMEPEVEWKALGRPQCGIL